MASRRFIRAPRRKGLFASLAVVAIIVAQLLDVTPAGAAVQVIGEGASFPLIEIEQWRADVAQPPYNLQIIYNGTSSGQGRDEFKAGRVDFGVSDIPYPNGSEPSFPFGYVPLSAGGIAFMFNLSDVAGRRVRDLRLTPTTVCKLLTGQITSWTDPEIVADNPKFVAGFLALDKVKVIMRSGAAGTSYILGDYCQKLAPAVWQKFTVDGPGFQGGAPWANHPGPPLSQWPAPPGGANAGGSDQNANTVASGATGAGAITAVETGFAHERNFPVASVQNDVGVFVQPTEAAVTTALSYAGKDPRGTQKLVFNPGNADAYNPSTYSYAIVKTGAGSMDAEKGSALAQFLYYSAGPGQLKAEDLGYAPLPQNLIEVAYQVASNIAGAPQLTVYVISEGGTDVPGGGGAGGAGGGGGGAGGGGAGAGGGGGGGGGAAAGGGGSAGGDATSQTGDDGSGGGGGDNGTSGGAGDGSVGDAAQSGGPSGPNATAANRTAVTTKSGAVVKTPGGPKAGNSTELVSGPLEQARPYPVQPLGEDSSDSVLPLGWVLAMGGAGFLFSRYRNRADRGEEVPLP
ncbi:MAG: substrate-binding domain-containing protein [Acidimicrobiales bacterium]